MLFVTAAASANASMARADPPRSNPPGAYPRRQAGRPAGGRRGGRAARGAVTGLDRMPRINRDWQWPAGRVQAGSSSQAWPTRALGQPVVACKWVSHAVSPT